MRAEPARVSGAGRPRPRRGARAAAALAALLLLLVGCASMPSSGPVQGVDPSQRTDGESQVRVFGLSPEEGAQPRQIVRGFLEAITSDEAQFETAKEYLTPQQRKVWDPFHETVVLSAGPHLGSTESVTTPDGRTETRYIGISGVQLASVDAASVYTPLERQYAEEFGLRRADDEWRIDTLPDGLIMAEADFRRNYRSVDAYYYAELGSASARAGNGDHVMVADPVYVRRRIDPIREVVASLLKGPSDWLAPVVETEFPEGVRLPRGHGPVIDESGLLTVRLTGVHMSGSPPSQCAGMAAQLLHSVQELSTVKVTDVRVANRAGTQLCELTRSRATEYAPGRLDGRDTRVPYYLNGEHQLVSVSADDATGTVPVAGPLGRGDVPLRDAAVSRGEARAAVVSADGVALYVAPLSADGELPDPVYSRPLAGEDDAGLTAPSWDGLGDLWFADRDPAGQRLLRLAGGRGTPQEVPVVGLREGQRIEALRVASDGVRIAMLVSEDEHTSLQLGRVERDGRAVVGVADLRQAAPQLEHVAAVSWAGDSSLVVVGRPADGLEQWQFVSTDGSWSTTPTVPGLNDVTGVAAAEVEGKPLLAETADAIARLDDDAQWRLIASETEHMSGPFYPG